MYKYCSQNDLLYKLFFDKDHRDHMMRLVYLFLIHPPMKQLVPFLVLGIAISAVPFAFGASGDTTAPMGTTTVTPTTVATPTATVTSTGVATPTATVTSQTTVNPMALSAAPSVSPAAGSALGEYRAVNCSTSTVFSTNSCDQCFDGGAVKPGTRITGLFDNWTNASSNYLVAYKEEQKSPNMVKFGNSTWTATPADDTKIWKYSSDVQWIGGSGTTASGATRSSFMVNPGSKVKFYEADLGAGYTFEKTDKKNGEMIGMLRFPVVAHIMDMTTATEAPATTHYECVAYKYDAPVAPTGTGGATPTKPVPPKEATETQTGPETLLLIAAAFFIAFGMMFTLRRRV